SGTACLFQQHRNRAGLGRGHHNMPALITQPGKKMEQLHRRTTQGRLVGEEEDPDRLSVQRGHEGFSSMFRDEISSCTISENSSPNRSILKLPSMVSTAFPPNRFSSP